MCPLRSTRCHQSFAFQNEAVDPNMNKGRYNSNFKQMCCYFSSTVCSLSFSPNQGAKDANFPLTSKLYTFPWGI